MTMTLDSLRVELESAKTRDEVLLLNEKINAFSNIERESREIRRENREIEREKLV
jgi:hypothetical protein